MSRAKNATSGCSSSNHWVVTTWCPQTSQSSPMLLKTPSPKGTALKKLEDQTVPGTGPLHTLLPWAGSPVQCPQDVEKVTWSLVESLEDGSSSLSLSELQKPLFRMGRGFLLPAVRGHAAPTPRTWQPISLKGCIAPCSCELDCGGLQNRSQVLASLPF